MCRCPCRFPPSGGCPVFVGYPQSGGRERRTYPSSMATETAPGVYEIPQELKDFRDTIRQIVRERVAPRAAEIDATGEYPWDIRKLFAEQDILGLPFAEEI